MHENLGISGRERIESDDEGQLQDWVDGFIKPFASLEKRPARQNARPSFNNQDRDTGFSSPSQAHRD